MAITSIIDTDIRPSPDPVHVAERLQELRRSRYLSCNRRPRYLNYWNPGGVYRAEDVEIGQTIQRTRQNGEHNG